MKNFNFKNRLTSMLKVDLRRMFISPRTYIIIGVCLVIPILIFVMTSMMAGQPTTDQYGNVILDEFGNPVLMEGFKYVWQMLGSVSGNGASQGMSMDLVSMCNIDMLFLGISVLVCLFISDEFRCGYCKNLFTVRSNKLDYVISKTVVGFIGGAAMLMAFFIGMILGGAIAGISFTLPEGVNAANIVMCFLSKIFVSLVFVSIFVTMSIVGKQRAWLCMLAGLAIGMLLFATISIVTPLNATFLHVLLTMVGGVLFSIGMGAISNVILKKIKLI